MDVTITENLGSRWEKKIIILAKLWPLWWMWFLSSYVISCSDVFKPYTSLNCLNKKKKEKKKKRNTSDSHHEKSVRYSHSNWVMDNSAEDANKYHKEVKQEGSYNCLLFCYNSLILCHQVKALGIGVLFLVFRLRLKSHKRGFSFNS